MRLMQSLLFVGAIVVLHTVQGCSPTSPTLVQLGDEKITLQEFEEMYERNVGTRDTAQRTSIEEREKFLDLLINYRLKLRDAYARNLLHDNDVQDELRDYRSSVARTFMIEREIVEPGIQKMYERRKEELRASHILFRLNPNASPADTLAAWNRALDIIKQLDEGKDFGMLAAEQSEDQSARQNRGDVYYFSGGHMVPQFEDAAFGLKVGQYTKQPVRTQFGYHIIKLTDRKPAVYTIGASHIMISTRATTNDTAGVDSALLKIRALQDSLKAGHDFATLARNHSQDPGSARRGGALGHFSRRRFVQEFEEAAFKLKPGEISDVVKSPFGYHIIKCDEVRPLPPLEEIRTEIQRIYQSYRYNDDYQAYLNRLKLRVGFSMDDGAIQEFAAQLDTTKTPGDSLWAESVTPAVRKKTVLTVGHQALSVDSLISLLSTKDEYKKTTLTLPMLVSHVEKIGEQMVLEAASIGLEDRYPEFKRLMKEFQDGVVLYKAEQMEVWNNIAVTDERLRSFYEERKHLYPLPDRVEFIEVSTDSQRLAARFISDLKRGRILDTLIARSKGKLTKTNRGFIPADTDTLSRLAWNSSEGSILGPVWHNGKHVVVQVIRKDAARYKTFEEVSAELSTAFQDQEAKRLEREWLERLRQRYPVVRHPEFLGKAFAGEQSSS